MVRKKVEGDEEQRRAAAREAHRAGEQPSARSATTGASKQRTHLAGSRTPHEEKLATTHRGKPEWRAGEGAEADTRRTPGPSRTPRVTGTGTRDYTEEHEKVFRALAEEEQAHGGEAVRLEDVSRAAHLPHEETRGVLHDLVTVHGLATEVQGAGEPDMGPRFETKPRR